MGRTDATPTLPTRDEVHRIGRYTVQLIEPHRWELRNDRRSLGFYTTRTAAHQAAESLDRRRALRVRLGRHVTVVAVALLTLMAALVNRSEPNPDFPPARAIADRFDRARLEIEAGDLEPQQVGDTFPGIEGATFEHGGRLKVGLSGMFEGNCFGMVWRPGYAPSMVVRSDYTTCSPDPSLIDQLDPAGLLAAEMMPGWQYVLPDENRAPVWLLPVVVISFGVVVGMGARALALLLSARR